MCYNLITYKKGANESKKGFYIKNHVSRIGEKKNYWNKMTNIQQNPTSLWALLHTVCVAQVNAKPFMLSVTYIVSIVMIL